MNDTHENDGEILQVVVRKSDASVAILWTQAHYDSWIYSNPGSGVAGGATAIEGPFQTIDDQYPFLPR